MMPSDNPEPQKGDNEKLDWKDYLAFIIALLQTTFLPIILTIIVLLGFILVIWLSKNISLAILFRLLAF